MKLDKTLEYAPSHLLEYDNICGIDEVGRGCGAGPVVACAVILPKNFSSPLLRDSKKLSEKQRHEAYKLIVDNAISISCIAGSVVSIDDLGINKATFEVMHKCIDNLSITPDYVLLDGTVWDNVGTTRVELVPKGDDTYMCIAAAAIVAKVRRDEYMVKLHEIFPNYSWDKNKGYLTTEHINGISTHGLTRYHRKLFVKNFVK